MATAAAFTMRELMEAGVHYGHKTKRWNPRMAPYIYGVRNDLHIINLQQTVPLLHQALNAVRGVAESNGRVLFVGTKRQAQDPVAEAAKRCGQYYINQRWLGGMLTNWKTIQTSIRRLRNLEERLDGDHVGLTKKELLGLQRERDKLEKSLGGIKDMGGVPDLLFVIDTNLEDLAVKEAAKLNIPVVAILDTNSSLDGVSYPIPGNDDATRAIKLYCRLISDAVLSGMQAGLRHADVDMGESEEVPFSGEEGEDAPKGKNTRKAAPAKKAPAVVVKKASPTKRKAEAADEAVEADAAAEKAPAKKAAAKKGKSEDAA
jgi:small subunit ribosomal protein S2